MKISIVIPAFNEEKYLPYTLFHAGQLNPYEIIVADCHSTDRTASIAKKFKAKIVFSDERNPGTARNAGAKAAKGDVLLFLDADTIPFFNIIYEIKKAFKNRKVVGWTCPLYAFSPSKKEQAIYELSNQIVRFLIEVVKRPNSPGAVMAVRKKIFDQIGGFDENLKTAEDLDLSEKTKKYGKFIFCMKSCAFTSTRRLRKWGIANILKNYSKTYFDFLMRKKSRLNNGYDIVR